MSTNPAPTGYTTCSPYIISKDIDSLVKFLVDVFSGEIVKRITTRQGEPSHAVVCIGDTAVMMGPAKDDFPPIPGSLYIYVNSCDEVFGKAQAAGATTLMPPEDQFYGDRTAGVRDQWGNFWWIAQHLETLTPKEIQKRAILAGK